MPRASGSGIKKANHKMVKKCLNYAFLWSEKKLILNTSNYCRRKKGKKLIIPADIIGGNTLYGFFCNLIDICPLFHQKLLDKKKITIRGILIKIFYSRVLTYL